jgi:hypothetical protein
VTFTPGDVGARAAVLTVTGSKGGIWTVQLTGTGLSLVQLIPMAANSIPATPVTGLDFGTWPNGTPKPLPLGGVLQYRVVVRGAAPATATSTVDTLALVTGTTTGTASDFIYVDATGAVIPSNPCNSKTLALPPAGTVSPWIFTANSTAKDPGVLGATGDAQATLGFWTCDFYVQFYPQTGKSATPKTATLNASATGGGTASLTLTGIASGPLTITPTAPNIAAAVQLGGSSAATTFTVVNNGAANVNQGQLTVALGGANASEFGIVADACSTHAALVPNTSTTTTLTPGSFCTLGVEFAPISVGAKTATVTVTSGTSTETAIATITATAGQALAITVTPTAAAPASVAFDSVAQANVGAWKTFTIANPAGAPLTGKITYGVTGAYQLYTLATAGVTSYPTGFCGDTNTKQLNPGESCTIQVRFAPVNTVAPGAITGTLIVQDQNSTALPTIPLKGTSMSQITLSGAPITVVAGVQTVDFGSVATGVSSTKTITVTNNGAATAAGGVTLAITNPFPADYGIAQTSGCVATPAVPGGGTCQLVLQYTGVAPVTEPAATIYVGNTAATNLADRAALALAAKSVSPAVLALSGFGDYVPDATFPAAGQGIDFGSVPLSTPSGVLTLWFTNVGGVAATGLDSTLAETGGGTEFAVVAENKGTCSSIGGTLAPTATCSVNVQFTPTGTLGKKTAIFSLLATAVSAVPVNLQGTAISTANSVFIVAKGGTNSFYNFATTSSVSTTGTKAYFVLQNNLPAGANATLNLGTDAASFTGGVPPVDIVKVAGIGRPGDFLLTKETDGTGTVCGATLASASSCTFAVTFKPTTFDPATLYQWAAIALTNHAIPTGGGHGDGNLLGVFGQVQKPAKLQLSATLAGVATIAPTTADFGQILQGQLTPIVFTITNTGDVATAGAVQAVIAGTSATGIYALVTATTCGSTALASLGTCTATLTAQLTSSVGPQSGLTVQATGATGEASPTVALTAEVVNPATLVLAPSATTFADTVAGGTASLTITVTNGATADTNNTRQDSGALIVTLSNSTDFTVNTATNLSTCLTSTGAYEALPGKTASTTALNTCNIVVVFSPLSAGAKTLTVTVAGNPGGSVQTGALTGNGLSDMAFTNAGNAAGTAAAPLVLGTGKFVVKNTAATTATGVLRETIAGTNFAITADSCYGNSLTAGSTCEVDVSFLGTASATEQDGSLAVTDGTANNSLTAYFKVVTP